MAFRAAKKTRRILDRGTAFLRPCFLQNTHTQKQRFFFFRKRKSFVEEKEDEKLFEFLDVEGAVQWEDRGLWSRRTSIIEEDTSITTTQERKSYIFRISPPPRRKKFLKERMIKREQWEQCVNEKPACTTVKERQGVFLCHYGWRSAV